MTPPAIRWRSLQAHPLATVAHSPAPAWDGRSLRIEKSEEAGSRCGGWPRDASLPRSFLPLHVIGQFGELYAGGAQGLGRVLAHGVCELLGHIVCGDGELFVPCG